MRPHILPHTHTLTLGRGKCTARKKPLKVLHNCVALALHKHMPAFEANFMQLTHWCNNKLNFTPSSRCILLSFILFPFKPSTPLNSFSSIHKIIQANFICTNVRDLFAFGFVTHRLSPSIFLLASESGTTPSWMSGLLSCELVCRKSPRGEKMWHSG